MTTDLQPDRLPSTLTFAKRYTTLSLVEPEQHKNTTQKGSHVTRAMTRAKGRVRARAVASQNNQLSQGPKRVRECRTRCSHPSQEPNRIRPRLPLPRQGASAPAWDPAVAARTEPRQRHGADMRAASFRPRRRRDRAILRLRVERAVQVSSRGRGGN